MNKRVFIIHGWGGNPEESWFPWLKKELESKGFEVTIPALPEPEEPRISTWIPAIAKAVKNPDEHTYFIGHSMGNQAVARYLESLPTEIKIGGVVFVAGFFKSLSGLTDEELETRNHWLDAPIDLQKVKTHFSKSVAIFSDDDPFVPLENRDEFENILGSKIIIEKGMGHINGETHIFDLPSARDALLEIAA